MSANTGITTQSLGRFVVRFCEDSRDGFVGFEPAITDGMGRATVVPEVDAVTVSVVSAVEVGVVGDVNTFGSTISGKCEPVEVGDFLSELPDDSDDDIYSPFSMTVNVPIPGCSVAAVVAGAGTRQGERCGFDAFGDPFPESGMASDGSVPSAE